MPDRPGEQPAADGKVSLQMLNFNERAASIVLYHKGHKEHEGSDMLTDDALDVAFDR